jgi:N-acyl-D-amino-acid deacylase
VGETFDRILDERGQHASDTLADWALETDLKAEFVYPFTNTDLDEVGRLLVGEENIISGSDAGAHIGMFDGAGDTTLILTRHVRDRADLTLEDAVRRMTHDQAEVLRLADRGVIDAGAIADIAVFDLAALEWSREVRVNDLPGGLSRFRRANTGFRYTFVGGVVVQQGGTATGALPASFLGAEDRVAQRSMVPAA